VFRALSLLPLPLLYAIFGAVAWCLRIVGWRRDLVADKLARCLPELAPAERATILSGFYAYLGELAAEVLHACRISRTNLERRLRFDNPEVVLQALRDDRRVMLLAAHHCNWEWLVQRCSIAFGAPLVAAYKPASWAHADRTLGFLRTRFGAEMVPAGRLVNLLLERRGRVNLLAMVADQSPPAGSEQQAWLRFFGQPTAFFPGPGWIGARMGYEPFFVAMRRVGRGRYAARLVPLLGSGEPPAPGLLLAAYVAALEAQVRAHPAQYLWAYNRWKRPRRLYD
jgi:KDO2-lipid IV(A) lauroyltransferase